MSDTHSSPYTINLDADIIVAAGDLSNGVKGVFDFVKKCQEAEKEQRDHRGRSAGRRGAAAEDHR